MFIIKVTGKQKICAIILEQVSLGRSKVQTASIIMPSCSRKSSNPPWQNSVRPLSQEAYNYILNSSGIVPAHMSETAETVDELKEKLKSAVKAFYVDQDLSAIQRIEQLSAKIGQLVLSTET